MAAKPLSEAQIIQHVRENFGFVAGFLDIPEVRKVLIDLGRRAQAGQDFSKEYIQGRLYATSWWKKTAEVTRQWTALQSTDPASANKLIAQTRAQIVQAAKQAGVAVTDAQVTQWSYAVNKYGWTPQQVQQGIGAQFKYNPAKAASGQAQLTVDALKAKAAEYLVPLSDGTIQKWARDVVGGNVDLAAFESYAKEQAKSMFPGLSAALDAGVTVAQYVAPYKEIAAQTLEIPPEQVNFMEPRWNAAVQKIDPKTGLRTSMSLSDWQTELRTNKQYGFDKTSQAREQASQLTTRLGELFGAI